MPLFFWFDHQGRNCQIFSLLNILVQTMTPRRHFEIIWPLQMAVIYNPAYTYKFQLKTTRVKLFEEGRTFRLTVVCTRVQRYNGKKLDDLDIVFEWLLLKHWIYLKYTYFEHINLTHFLPSFTFSNYFPWKYFLRKHSVFLDGVFKVYRSGHQCVKEVTNLKTPSIWNVIFFILGHSQGIRILATKKREKKKRKNMAEMYLCIVIVNFEQWKSARFEI